MLYVMLLLVAVLAIIGTMPVNLWLSNKLDLIDKPDERKVHQELKLRGGGISLYFMFIPFLFILYMVNGNKEIIAMIVASIILFITGVLDDKYSLNAKLKLFLQITSASSAFLLGIRITEINPIGIEFNIIGSYLITVFWIILLINAMNLIDGLDGLASGVGAIIFFVIFFVAVDDMTKIIAIFVIGMLIGFLKYNFFPSRIFLGDTGSMFLGLLVAILSITGVGKTAVSITTILILVSFPLLDVGMAIIRRLIHKQSIFAPDKNHMHHCFMNKGFSHKHTVVLIYMMNIAFALLAYLSIISINITFLIIVGYIVLIAFIIFYLNIFNIHKSFRIKN